MMSNSNNFQNINVSNTLTATNLNCNNMTADNLVFNNLTLTGKINNNTTAQNLNSLDTTTSISSQFIDAKNYTDNKINLLLNNPDVNINSIQELFNILGNDPNLNVVNSLASKISKTESNQTIDALNLNFTNPILSSDYLLRNTDNSTKSIKNSIETNETNITSLTNNKANKNADTLTNCSFNSCRITGEGLYLPNQTSNANITLTRGNNLITCNQNEVRELDFCNINNVNWGTTERAFSFKKMNNLNVLEELLRINVNGSANLLGDLTTNGISISSLNTSLNNINNTITISNNNVGIGTNPTGKLHVVGNSIFNGNTTITNSLNSGSVSSSSNITSSGNMVCLGLIHGNVVQANSGNLLSLNRDITNAVTHINGRLGIGISTPVLGSSLHVIGDTTITGSLGATNAIKCDVLQTNNPNKILSINAGLDDTAITYIKGKLGVGTNNIVEGSDLHVVGNASIDGALHVSNIITSSTDFRIGFNGVPFSSQFATLEYTRIKAFGKLRLQVFPSVVISVDQVGLSSYAIDASNGTLFFNLNPITNNGIILVQIVETNISQATYGGWTTTAIGSFTFNGVSYTHKITCWIPPANQVFTSSVAQKQLQNFDFSVL